MSTPKSIVEGFLKEVRSGKNPDAAKDFMADTVSAHQVLAEGEVTVKRTPENYAAHIKDFKKLFGDFSFEILELIAEDSRVYVRWKQTGKHLNELDGYAATHLPLIEITSVVYKVVDDKITEYWLQTDRMGFDVQLKNNALQIPQPK